MIEKEIIVGKLISTHSGTSLSGPYSRNIEHDITLNLLTPEFQKVIKQYLNIPG